MAVPVLAPGFADPVHQSQRAFRALMAAMAEPGRIFALPAPLAPPAPLTPELAALALTLADFETPLFLDAPLAAGEAVRSFLAFHTGAPIVADPSAACFALLRDGAALPDLSAFAQGEPDYPDRAATLIVAVDQIGDGPLRLEGPGISGRRTFGAAPLPADFSRRLAANGRGFPLGVDIVLTAPGRIAALPRSVRLAEGG
jgi:alpha-D-ribose 1-methylphosphonate 5-triphosphate synthase subunit PhnH